MRSGRNVNETVAVGLPRSLTVSAIDLETPLIPLGLAADGTAAVPDDPEDAGWFSAGPRPGEVGPAVVMGHIDSRTGPAVFARLSELAPGDEVVVGTDSGDQTFTVDRTQQVAKDEFPTDEVYGARPDPALRLITCGGEFDRSTGHYRDNVIVYLRLTGATDRKAS